MRVHVSGVWCVIYVLRCVCVRERGSDCVCERARGAGGVYVFVHMHVQASAWA